MPLGLLFLGLFAVPARAAVDGERLRAAAAAVAVELSSATASTATISVETSGGPADAAVLLDHFLRAELLKTGRGVYPAGADAEYDLKGALVPVRDGWTFAATLSRRGDRRLVGATERTWSDVVTAAPLPVSSPTVVAVSSGARVFVPRRMSLWLTGSHFTRRDNWSWSAGAFVRSPSQRWEAGFDFSEYDQEIMFREEYHAGIANPGLFYPWIEHLAMSVRAFDLRGAYLHPSGLKWPSYVKAGVGLRMLRVEGESKQAGPRAVSTSIAFTTFAPVFSVSLVREFFGGIDAELKGEWSPERGVVGPLKTGGFAGYFGIAVRPPKAWIPKLPRPEWMGGGR